MKQLPKLLNAEEAMWLGLPVMIPDFPPEEILAIEAKWFKTDLQRLANENLLRPDGDKELLVIKLRYIGVLDKDGKEVPQEKRERRPVTKSKIKPIGKALEVTTESIISNWTGKPKNISLLKRDIEQLRKTYDLMDVDDAIAEYEGISREDYEDKEDYQQERDDAWDNILDTLENAEEREQQPVKAGILPQTSKKPAERMPRINPHASAIEQDKQLRKQSRWLKDHGFKTPREAQEAGY